MSGFNSGSTARLVVQVASKSEIALHRHCPRCKQQRRFASSGKFRVNAQKKRIDAWLIFLCTTCDDRWNWPIHERRSVATLDTRELDAFMRNDPDLAARHGWIAVQTANAVAENDPIVSLAIQEPTTGATRTIEIVLVIAGASMRLDRLLAQALALARREIETMDQTGAMTIKPAARKALRRPAGDGQQIAIDLDRCSQETAARLRQLAEAQPPDLYCATLSPR